MKLTLMPQKSEVAFIALIWSKMHSKKYDNEDCYCEDSWSSLIRSFCANSIRQLLLGIVIVLVIPIAQNLLKLMWIFCTNNWNNYNWFDDSFSEIVQIKVIVNYAIMIIVWSWFLENWLEQFMFCFISVSPVGHHSSVV